MIDYIDMVPPEVRTARTILAHAKSQLPWAYECNDQLLAYLDKHDAALWVILSD